MWLIELMMLVGNKHKRRTSNFVADNLISWEHTTAVRNLNILVDDSMISRALKLAKEDWDSQSYCKHRYQHMKNEHTCDYLESEAAKSWTRRIASWILRQLCMTYHSRWLFRVTSRSFFFFGASETTKLSSIGLQYRLPRCYDITQYFGTGDYWRPSSLISRKACFSSPMQTCSCDEKDSWCSYVSRRWTWSWQVILFMLITIF